MADLEKIVDDVCASFDVDFIIDQAFRCKLLNYLSEFYYDDRRFTDDELREILCDYMDQVINDEKTVNEISDNSLENDDIYNLSNEELVELYFSCDVSLKNKISEIIINKNDGFICFIAKKFYYSYTDNFDDLMQSGRLGLLKSLYNYDFSKASGSFLNFASHYIKSYMWNEKKKNRNLAISYSDYSNIILLSKVRLYLTMELGRTPTTEEIAMKMDKSVVAIEELLFLENDTSSLNVCIDDKNNVELMDLYVDSNGFNILEYIERMDALEWLDYILMNSLTDSEAFVVKYSLGFIDNDTHTLNDVADALAKHRGDMKVLSHQRISQIYQSAISKLSKDKDFLKWARIFDGNSERIRSANRLECETRVHKS